MQGAPALSGKGHASEPDPIRPAFNLSESGLAEAVEGPGAEHLKKVLPDFLAAQRWFAGKGGAVQVRDITVIGSLPGQPNQLTVLEAETEAGERQKYLLPLTVRSGASSRSGATPQNSRALAQVRHGAGTGELVDASFDEQFIRDLVTAMHAGSELRGAAGSIRFTATPAFRALELNGEIRALGAEQSNVSILVGDAAMVKLYRRLRSGEQPEIEVARFLTEVAGFPNTPAFFGNADFISPQGEITALAAAFAFVRNQGDTWSVVLESLESALKAPPEDADFAEFQPDFRQPLDLAATLGRRTGELHLALATPTDDAAFAPEPIDAADLSRWVEGAKREAAHSLAVLERAASSAPEPVRHDVSRLLDARQTILDRLDAIRGLSPSGVKTRIHGDYHLGQVLAAGDDVVIIDFEGEPQRDVHERREKTSPLRDVAGMLRSFDYAAWSVLDRLRSTGATLNNQVHAGAFAWRDAAVGRFLEEYWRPTVGLLPQDADTRRGLLDLFLIQKAFYEVGYEAANRPSWLSIPVRGLLDLVFPPKANA